MTALEDLYALYKPKRRTRAMIAREKGLEGLANHILNQTITQRSIEDIIVSSQFFGESLAVAGLLTEPPWLSWETGHSHPGLLRRYQTPCNAKVFSTQRRKEIKKVRETTKLFLNAT